MATDTQLEALSETLSSDRLPFFTGTISPPPDGFRPYYVGSDIK